MERPRRADRRRGKSDPVDAHLAALQVLRMSADRLPAPRADGDREALRILLSARREVVIARTRQVSRLRALLLSGSDSDSDPVTGNAHRSPSPGNRPAARPRRRYHRAGRAPRRPRTHACITRRRAAGKSDTEIRRALKRYIARELFRALEAAPAA